MTWVKRICGRVIILMTRDDLQIYLNIIRKNKYILDKEMTEAILGMLGIKVNLNKIMINTEEGVRFDMCKAWDDHREYGRQEGEREALKKSLRALVDSLKRFSLDLEAVYNAVIENELYKEVTKEQVRDYYYAK